MLRFVIVVSLVLAVASATFGCGARRRQGAGAACELSSECSAPLVCRLGRCRNECATSGDCPEGLACVLDAIGLGSCQVESERTCTLSSECPSPLVCRLRQCVNECVTSRDCLGGAVCTDVAGGRGCIDVSTVSCVSDGECRVMDPGTFCLVGRCRPQCATDRDCRRDYYCDPSGACMPPPRPPPGDAGPVDAGTGDAASGDAGPIDARAGGWIRTLREERAGVDPWCVAVVGTQVVFVTHPVITMPGGTVDVFDMSSGLWTSLPFPQARLRISCATSGTEVYLTGGYYSTPGGDELADVVVYDSSAGTLTPLGTSTSEPRYGAAVVRCRDTLLVAGGIPSNATGSASSVVDSVDLLSPVGSSATSLPEPLTSLAAAADGTRAFFAGGLRGLMFGTGYASATLHVFDCAAGTWSSSTMPHFLVPADPTAVVLGTRVHVAGTVVDNGTAPFPTLTETHGIIDVYDTASSTWTSITTPSAYESPRIAASATHFFHGGSSGAPGEPSGIDAMRVSDGVWSSGTVDYRIEEISSDGSSLIVVGVSPASGALVVERYTIP